MHGLRHHKEGGYYFVVVDVGGRLCVTVEFIRVPCYGDKSMVILFYS